MTHGRPSNEKSDDTHMTAEFMELFRAIQGLTHFMAQQVHLQHNDDLHRPVDD